MTSYVAMCMDTARLTGILVPSQITGEEKSAKVNLDWEDMCVCVCTYVCVRTCCVRTLSSSGIEGGPCPCRAQHSSP